jgi:hypothetical protein
MAAEQYEEGFAVSFQDFTAQRLIGVRAVVVAFVL